MLYIIMIELMNFDDSEQYGYFMITVSFLLIRNSI